MGVPGMSSCRSLGTGPSDGAVAQEAADGLRTAQCRRILGWTQERRIKDKDGSTHIVRGPHAAEGLP